MNRPDVHKAMAILTLVALLCVQCSVANPFTAINAGLVEGSEQKFDGLMADIQAGANRNAATGTPPIDIRRALQQQTEAWAKMSELSKRTQKTLAAILHSKLLAAMPPAHATTPSIRPAADDGNDSAVPQAVLSTFNYTISTRQSIFKHLGEFLVTSKLINTGSSPIALLLWPTPFQPILEDDVFVTRPDSSHYLGAIKEHFQSVPTAEDVVVLQPGQSLEKTHDIARYVSFLTVDKYMLKMKFDLSVYPAITTEAAKLAAINAKAITQETAKQEEISSNWIVVDVRDAFTRPQAVVEQEEGESDRCYVLRKSHARARKLAADAQKLATTKAKVAANNTANAALQKAAQQAAAQAGKALTVADEAQEALCSGVTDSKLRVLDDKEKLPPIQVNDAGGLIGDKPQAALLHRIVRTAKPTTRSPTRRHRRGYRRFLIRYKKRSRRSMIRYKKRRRGEIDLQGLPVSPLGFSFSDGDNKCTEHQKKVIRAAYTKAQGMIANAVLAMAEKLDGPEWQKWFGSRQVFRGGVYTGAQQTLNSFRDEVQQKLFHGGIVFQCGGMPQVFLSGGEMVHPEKKQQCADSVYAFVFASSKRHDLYLCAGFWDAPSGKTRDSQPGTIIHELTHFENVMGTKDHAYGTDALLTLAKTKAHTARDNADSIEAYTEMLPKVAPVAPATAAPATAAPATAAPATAAPATSSPVPPTARQPIAPRKCTAADMALLAAGSADQASAQCKACFKANNGDPAKCKPAAALPISPARNRAPGTPNTAAPKRMAAAAQAFGRCTDNDAGMRAASGGTTSDCASVASLCTDPDKGPLIRKNCPKTCGACPKAAAAAPKGCKDDDAGMRAASGGTTSDCASVASLCNNPDKGPLIRKNCPKTCGACPKAAAAAPVGCVDSDAAIKKESLGGMPSCAAASGFCNDPSYAKMTRKNCPKTCGVCQLSGCNDNDAGIKAHLGSFWYCAAAKHYCTDPSHGPVARKYCPKTCGLCCKDNDVGIKADSGGGVPSCAAVKQFCQDPDKGPMMRKNCPKACGVCRSDR